MHRYSSAERFWTRPACWSGCGDNIVATTSRHATSLQRDCNRSASLLLSDPLRDRYHPLSDTSHSSELGPTKECGFGAPRGLLKCRHQAIHCTYRWKAPIGCINTLLPRTFGTGTRVGPRGAQHNARRSCGADNGQLRGNTLLLSSPSSPGA